MATLNDAKPNFSTYGQKGGIIRARRLSHERRQEIARKAALARHERTPKTQRRAAALKAIRARWKAYRAKKRDR